jgi:hypothetical protein
MIRPSMSCCRRACPKKGTGPLGKVVAVNSLNIMKGTVPFLGKALPEDGLLIHLALFSLC